MTDQLDPLEYRIVYHLQNHWRFVVGNCWRSFDALAEELGADKYDLINAARRLRERGVLYYTPMFTEELRLAGSGYFLSAEWEPEYGAKRHGNILDEPTPKT